MNLEELPNNIFPNLNLLDNKLEDNLDIKNYQNLVENLDNIDYLIEYNEKYKESLTRFLILVDVIKSSFHDMYFMTRILKNDQASLVVSYFGYYHVEHIKKIFELVLNYHIHFKIENPLRFVGKDFYKRCLFIGGVHETINLSKDVYQHNLRR